MNKSPKPKIIDKLLYYDNRFSFADSTKHEPNYMGLYLYENIEYISGIKISSDNKYLATWSTKEKILIVWNIINRIVQKNIKYTSLIYSANFTPNGNYLIVSTDNYQLKIYNLENFEDYFTFYLDEKLLMLKTIENDCFYGIDPKNNIFFGDISRKISKVLHLDLNHIKSFDICSSKNFLAVGDVSGYLGIIDLNTKMPIYKYEQQLYIPLCINFHPTESLVFVSFSDFTIKVFSFATEKLTIYHIFHAKALVWEFYFCKNLIISKSHKNLIQKWKFSKTQFELKKTQPELIKTQGKISSFCISTDNTLLFYATSECSFICMDLDRQLKLFELGLHTTKITEIFYLKDKLWIVSLSTDKIMRIWDSLNNICLAVHKILSKEVITLALSKREKFLVTCDNDFKIIIYRQVKFLIDQTADT